MPAAGRGAGIPRGFLPFDCGIFRTPPPPCLVVSEIRVWPIGWCHHRIGERRADRSGGASCVSRTDTRCGLVLDVTLGGSQMPSQFHQGFTGSPRAAPLEPGDFPHAAEESTAAGVLVVDDESLV